MEQELTGRKPGPKPKEWYRMTWVHANGSEMTIERDTKKHCLEMFLVNVTDPNEWREKK